MTERSVNQMSQNGVHQNDFKRSLFAHLFRLFSEATLALAAGRTTAEISLGTPGTLAQTKQQIARLLFSHIDYITGSTQHLALAFSIFCIP